MYFIILINTLIKSESTSTKRSDSSSHLDQMTGFLNSVVGKPTLKWAFDQTYDLAPNSLIQTSSQYVITNFRATKFCSMFFNEKPGLKLYNLS